MATEPFAGEEPRSPIPFASRAFGAVHTLLFVVDDAGSDRDRIAHAIVELFHELVPGLPVGVWWTAPDGRESELAAGDAPPLLQRLPFADPPELCLIEHGDAYDATLFGIHGAHWRFVPITDRQQLYGWIGLGVDVVPRESGMLPFLCTVGALVGAALTRHHLRSELLEEARTITRLERYLSPQLARSLRNDAFEERCVDEAAILCLDLAEFTRRLFSQDHMDLLKELNAFFTRAVETVFLYDGIVDKLLGDGLLAVFGILPHEPAAPCQRAIDAAKALLAVTEAFNHEYEPAVPYQVRIGVATGAVHVGHVGGGSFFDLTVLGAPVALADRLQRLAKARGASLLIDGRTHAHLTNEEDWVALGPLELPGIPNPIEVWQPANLSSSTTAT